MAMVAARLAAAVATRPGSAEAKGRSGMSSWKAAKTASQEAAEIARVRIVTC